MVENQWYSRGYITHGSYFVYKGIKYGEHTTVLFKEDFYERVGDHETDPMRFFGWKYPYYRMFQSIETKNDKMIWNFSTSDKWSIDRSFVNFVPERDIEKIVGPVYYITPKELVKLRFNNGTWFNYIWQQTLAYLVCLLVTSICTQWYLTWTIGLYLYLRLCYIELSKEEFIR